MTDRTVSAWAGAACTIAATAYWTMMSERSQLLGDFPFAAETTEKVVALTFDDGPNEPFTTQVAATLERHGVLGTFFQVGVNLIRFPDTSRRLLDHGHTLGNHSFTHRLSRCLRQRAVATEIDRGQDAFIETLGITPALYRPPWLVRTPGTFRALSARGLRAISGTFCHPLEVVRASQHRIAVRATRTAHPGSIIIFHDGYNAKGADRSRTVAALDEFIVAMRREGFTFATVDQLLGIPAYQ